MKPSSPAPAVGIARLGQRTIAGFRFHHMLVRFSRDVRRLDHLAKIEIDRVAAADAVEHMADALNLPLPQLSFSRRRRHADGTPTGTGMTIWSVADLEAMHGASRVREWQEAGVLRHSLPNHRLIKLGDPTLLASAAHEVAHVHVAERSLRAPAHGKIFVAALDDTAEAAARWLRDRHPDLSSVF